MVDWRTEDEMNKNNHVEIVRLIFEKLLFNSEKHMLDVNKFWDKIEKAGSR